MKKEIEKKINHVKDQLAFSSNYYIENNLIPYVKEECVNGFKASSKINPFELDPCLTETEIIELEEKYHITIPEEFKAFLLRVGNGGGAFFKPLEKLIKNTLQNGDEDFQFRKDFIIEEVTTTYMASGKLILYDYYPYDQWLIVAGAHTGSIYDFFTEGCYEAEDIKLLNISFLDYFSESIKEKLHQLKTLSKNL